MLTLKPVNNKEELNVDDMLFLKHRKGSSVVRVACIDGEEIVVESAHANLPFKGNGGDFHKGTIDKMLLKCQILKVCSDEKTK